MRRGAGAWALPAILLFVAVVALLTAEFVQWRRFEGRRRHVEAALAEFKARCPLARKEGFDVRLARGSQLAPGSIQIGTDDDTRTFRQRVAGWTLTGVIPGTGDPRGGLTSKMGMVVLVQNRTMLMEPPHLHLLGRMDPSLQAVFDEILAAEGLKYSRDNPFPR